MTKPAQPPLLHAAYSSSIPIGSIPTVNTTVAHAGMTHPAEYTSLFFLQTLLMHLPYMVEWFRNGKVYKHCYISEY